MRKLILGLALIMLPFGLQAKPDDAHALEGVTTGKVAWDITVGETPKLVLFLKVIEETYDDLVRQGVTPDMVFTFHGPVMKLITTDHSGLDADEVAERQRIADLLGAMMARPGVRMEACAVAERLMKMEGAAYLPGIERVGNTFVSQIGYQAKGYAVIPIH